MIKCSVCVCVCVCVCLAPSVLILGVDVAAYLHQKLYCGEVARAHSIVQARGSFVADLTTAS